MAELTCVLRDAHVLTSFWSVAEPTRMLKSYAGTIQAYNYPDTLLEGSTHPCGSLLQTRFQNTKAPIDRFALLWLSRRAWPIFYTCVGWRFECSQIYCPKDGMGIFKLLSCRTEPGRNPILGAIIGASQRFCLAPTLLASRQEVSAEMKIYVGVRNALCPARMLFREGQSGAFYGVCLGDTTPRTPHQSLWRDGPCSFRETANMRKLCPANSLIYSDR